MAKMRQSVQKELGLFNQNTDSKVRNPQPYTRHEKHKTNLILVY